MPRVLIHWCKKDIQYLLDNYEKKGNLQISRELNQLRRSFLVINGERVYRVYKPKHIEKKMNLLGIKRSEESLRKIRKNSGALTSEDNLWTRGILRAAGENEIRVWNKSRPEKHIKVNGKFVKYSRWLWEQKNGEVPKGHVIIYKDGNSMNCSIENLMLAKRKDVMAKNSGTVNLTDPMVACYMTGNRKTDLTAELLKHPNLISLKRQQLLLKRKLKENGSQQNFRKNDREHL